ncbi:MAG TPA: sigma D regulator [Gammaproteobacteria bacterium]|jgi:regulator of sigma D|nr:sigma D regulator [Gammaproteobacteria bacterium]
MLKQIQDRKEQWGGVNTIINTWLDERQELIRLFFTLTKDKVNIDESESEFLIRLERFCEVLMDYLSAGHFEVFTELENEARTFDSRGIQLVKALYPYLQQSTELALWFNERFEKLRHSKEGIKEVHSELSYLGESLTDRFELEDQLIEYVHNSSSVVPQ